MKLCSGPSGSRQVTEWSDGQLHEHMHRLTQRHTHTQAYFVVDQNVVTCTYTSNAFIF